MKNTEERQPPEVLTSDTNNATTIDPSEAPGNKKYKFRKFRAYNTGTWNGPKRENKEVIYRQDRLHRYDSISTSLSLTDYQKSRGRKFIDDIDFEEMGIRVDVIIFGVCVLVANDDVRDGKRYYPDPHAANDRCFQKVADSIDLEAREQRKVTEKVRDKINL